MDYEKKYNEALKWMRELYPGLHGATKEDAEHFFPELRENKDERIRKALTNLIESRYASLAWIEGVPKDDILAWLEKQKEQKPNYCHYGGDPSIERCKYCSAACSARLTKEQKPADEAENFFDSAESYHQGFIAGQKKMKEDIEKGFGIGEHSLDYLAGRYAGYAAAKQEQKPAEWSEEDRKHLNSVLLSLNRPFYNMNEQEKSDFDWLKSLRPSWKPSEEQMEALEECGECKRCIKELYEQLKKL